MEDIMNETLERVQKIDKTGVKAGRLIRVVNTHKPKFSNAKDNYLSLWVEDPDGGNERVLLFTEREINLAEKRAMKNPEDCPKKCLIQDLLD